MHSQRGVSDDLQSYIPMVCTNSPANGTHNTLSVCIVLKICFFIGKAFCASHCIKVAELGYPTDLKEFLRSCSDTRQTVDPDEYSKPMKQRVDEELKMIAKKNGRVSHHCSNGHRSTRNFLFTAQHSI